MSRIREFIQQLRSRLHFQFERKHWEIGSILFGIFAVGLVIVPKFFSFLSVELRLRPQRVITGLVIFLGVNGIGFLISVVRPAWVQKIKDGIRAMGSRGKDHGQRIGQIGIAKSQSWIEKFRGSSPKDRLKMVSLPVTVVIIAVCIIQFGHYFVPPKVTYTFPDENGVETPLDSTIEVIFDRPIVASMAEKTFVITPHVTGKIAWENDQKFIFTPDQPFARATKYTTEFRGPILSKLFVPLFSQFKRSFETIGDPKIVLNSPVTDALEDQTAITVMFDRPMIALTTATNSAERPPAFSVSPRIDGEGRWLGTTAYQFRPKNAYQKATTYTVTVPPMKSLDGGDFEGYSWQFSSIRPRVVTINPSFNYEYASTVASVAAIFNQPMSLASAKDHFFVYDNRNNSIPGQIRIKGTDVGFYPTRPLNREEQYKAVILPGITGLEGPNGMNDEYSWTFKVTALPIVTSTTPSQGDTDVSRENSIDVIFKTPMDATTFKENVRISPEPETEPNVSFYTHNGKNQLTIGTYLGRSKTYSVTLGSGITDQYGTPIAPYTFTFQTAPYKPSVSISPFGTYFASFNQTIIPRIVAQATNVNRVDYALYSLSKERFLDLYNRRYSDVCGSDQSCRNWQNYSVSGLPQVNTWSEDFSAEQNTPVHVVTKVTNPNGTNIPSGFYFLQVKIGTGAHDNMVMIVSKSTVTVKKSQDQIFTWAVNQTSGDVIPGMTMELTDKGGRVLSSGSTNGDGVYQNAVDLFNRNDYELFVFGKKDDDVVVAANAWADGINKYDFGLPSYYNYQEQKNYQIKDAYKMFLTFDRPIYRPGQTVFFTGAIRKDNDASYEQLSSGTNVTVSILDSMGKEFKSANASLSSFGTFAGDFPVSKEGGLGYYTAKVSYGGSSYTQSFQVEEYKKPELAVEVTQSQSSYITGESADVAIHAGYYFGSPVTDANVSWVTQGQNYYFRWDKDTRYEFGDPDTMPWYSWWYGRDGDTDFGKQLTQGKGKTDAKGDVRFTLPLDTTKQKMSQRITVEASVNDISNQMVAGSSSFIVHSSGLYIGVKADSYSNQPGKAAGVGIVAIDTKGNEVQNVPVKVELYKRQWDTVREKDPDDGQYYYVSKPKDTLVEQSEITTDSLGRGKVSFTPAEGGTYRVVARATDSVGHASVTGSYLWVSGYGFSTSRDNNDRIVLVPDKKDYFVGDELSLFVASPFASGSAKTLITAERGSVIDYRIVDTSDTSNNFKLSILPKYSPNVFIGAVLIKPGSAVKSPPEFKIGYSAINVTDKKQQMSVKITTNKTRYKPKETLQATIETLDALGHPVSADVAVGLSDKAVWDLSSVILPDIYKTFYQPRNLDVSTSHLMTISMDRINANTNLGAKGGSGGGCFTEDTPVLMKGGITKPISTVAVGDVVLTRKSEQDQTLVEAKVLETFKHEHISEYLILNGTLRVTPVHRMWVNGAWKVAGAIEMGDELLDIYGQPMVVRSIERVQGDFTVYNLEIETYRTYFAGGVYVHNQKGGDDTSRKNFMDTAYWNPHVTTGPAGKATLSIPLPDNLTTWRLSAIASSNESAFGSAISNFVVSRDILIRPFLPRFLSVGDEAQLGGIVVNTTDTPEKLSVTLQSEGVSILDPKTKSVTLDPGKEAKLTWKTKAGNVPEASFTVEVREEGGAVLDSATTKLPVHSASIPEVVATAGQVKDSAKETITLPKDVDPTLGQLDLQLSPTLGGGSLSSLSYLLSYPYWCIEQITSKFMPSVFVNTILKNAKLDSLGSLTTVGLDATISDGIQRLSTQQHPDGGFGWWIDYQSDPFLTAYALMGLKEAKKHSYTVPDQMINRAVNYLRTQLSSGSDTSSLNDRAFILYVLREENGMSSYASTLYQRRFELSLEARGYLSLALIYMPQMNGMGRALQNELISMAQKTATGTHWEEPKKRYYFMGSSTTTTAVMLEMIGEYDPNSPLIPEIIRYLVAAKSYNHWGSTRDTASVIKAISTRMLAAKDEQIDETYRVLVNNVLLKEGAFSKKDLLGFSTSTIGIDKLAVGGSTELSMTKSGKGNMYYNMNLRYYLPFDEIEPLEQGMVIMRELVDSSGKLLSQNSIPENSEAWVRLTIVAPAERRYVMLEDILPAGLEAVNESLKNVSTLAKTPPKTKQNGEQYLFGHKEYHDDKTTLFAQYLPAGVYELQYRVRATTPGRYHRLPAQISEMYFPDVSGHSDGGWFTVVPKN